MLLFPATAPFRPSDRPSDGLSINPPATRSGPERVCEEKEREGEGRHTARGNAERASHSLRASLPPSLPCSNFEAGAEDHEAERKKLTRGDGGAEEGSERASKRRMRRGTNARTRLPLLCSPLRDRTRGETDTAFDRRCRAANLEVASRPLHRCMGREGGKTERLAGADADGCVREGLKL